MKQNEINANNGKNDQKVTVTSLLNKITNVNNELVVIKENLFDKVYKFEDISGTVKLLEDLDIDCEISAKENKKLNKLDESIKKSLFNIRPTEERKSGPNITLSEMISKANILLDDLSNLQSNVA